MRGSGGAEALLAVLGGLIGALCILSVLTWIG